MLKQWISSLNLNLNERISSPLFGTFATTWSLWNFDILIYLFSSIPSPTQKIDFIYDKLSVGYGENIYLPLLTSILLFILFPKIEKLAYSYWINEKSERKKIKVSTENTTPWSDEEIRELRQNAINLEMDFHDFRAKKNAESNAIREERERDNDIIQKTIDDKDNTIKKLNNKITLLHKELKRENKDEENTAREKQNKELMISALLFLGKRKAEMAAPALVKKISEINSISELLAQHTIGLLENNSYVTKSYSNMNQYYEYKINKNGIAFLIENGEEG